MTTSRYQLAAAVAGSRVDADAGVLRGVSVITEGEIRTHGVYADSETLETVQAAGSAFDGGVKVKMNHGTGVESIIGRLNNFRIVGKQLLADLYLFKTHEAFPRIIEMAQTIPQSFGLSISFSGNVEEIAGQRFVRVTELYSVDLTDSPAANEKGLFAMKTKTQKQSPHEIRATLAAITDPVVRDRYFHDNEEAIKALATQDIQDRAVLAAAQKAIDAAPELEARLKIAFAKEFAATLGTKQNPAPTNMPLAIMCSLDEQIFGLEDHEITRRMSHAAAAREFQLSAEVLEAAEFTAIKKKFIISGLKVPGVDFSGIPITADDEREFKLSSKVRPVAQQLIDDFCRQIVSPEMIPTAGGANAREFLRRNNGGSYTTK